MPSARNMGDATRDTLLALAERVEAATGPDRELDGVIAEAAGWTRLYRTDAAADDPRDLWASPGGGIERSSPRDYTASIDAAMTLVPEGEVFDLSTNYTKPFAVIWTHEEQDWCPQGEAATPALALTAAALRARSAQ